MDNNIGFKELYEVSLKATYPIEMGDRKIEVGETIAVFDKLQIGNFEEKKNFISANGGFDNRARIWWEETKEIRVSLVQGVFSKPHLTLMTNAKYINNEGRSTVDINRRELVETDASGIATVNYLINTPVFVYDNETGERITDFTYTGNSISTNLNYKEIMVDYYYSYDNGYSVLSFGRGLTNGYLSLEGKTRVKDDITGQVTTGIIKIPKLKLLSNLSMRLGQDAVPLVGRLDAVAIPTGERGHKKVMELIFLNDDIDSDIQ
jgi:hypothetical protein